MEAPDKIKIGKYNITSDGNVVFGWVTNEPDCEAMQHDIEYIRAEVIEMSSDEESNTGEEIYYQEGYHEGEYCHKQSFCWGFQEGIEWLKSKL